MSGAPSAARVIDEASGLGSSIGKAEPRLELLVSAA